MNNRGSVTLEALLIFPLFIFGMIAIYDIGQSAMADASLYEAAAETVEYMAEYTYISQFSYVIPSLVFEDYIDDMALVDKYIKNGVDGVDFFGTLFLESENSVVLRVNYTKEINLPFLPCLTKEKSFTIKQRAYVGNDKDENEAVESVENNTVVYVAENESVYHENSECTHLSLTVLSENISAAKGMGYTACELCGDNCNGEVYITSTGGHYHSSMSCSGLKRTVYQINIDEIDGLKPCDRCGG